MKKISQDKIITAFLESIKDSKLKANDSRIDNLKKILKKNKVSTSKFKKSLLERTATEDGETGTIYSSFILNDKQVEKISKLKKLKLEQKIDPSVIGGIKIITKTKLYDYTIANNLKLLKEQMK